MITVNNKEELKALINQRIEEQGPNCDLNDIDVSGITDMSFLFCKSYFNGDISNWNVTNVKDMCCMFLESRFNGDISRWNVCTYEMTSMFRESELEVNGKTPTWYRE